MILPASFRLAPVNASLETLLLFSASDGLNPSHSHSLPPSRSLTYLDSRCSPPLADDLFFLDRSPRLVRVPALVLALGPRRIRLGRGNNSFALALGAVVWPSEEGEKGGQVAREKQEEACEARFAGCPEERSEPRILRGGREARDDP